MVPRTGTGLLAHMPLTASRRRWTIILSMIGIVGLALFHVQRPSTPFHVGSSVDAIWNYIHTDAASDGFSLKVLSITKSTRWSADVARVKAETSFSWKKKSLAVQTTLYSYENGLVTGVHSKWKLQWPF
jgi:hypothetical protein